MRHSFSLAVKDASLLIRHGLLLEPAVAPRIGSFVSERCAVIVAQGLTAPRIGAAHAHSDRPISVGSDS